MRAGSCERARGSGEHGGPTHSAAWGKYFLAVLNLYDYRGLVPVLPELWLLPTRLPFHPSRLWCHCRMVYLPLSYLYGKRHAARLSPIIEELARASSTPRATIESPGIARAKRSRRATRSRLVRRCSSSRAVFCSASKHAARAYCARERCATSSTRSGARTKTPTTSALGRSVSSCTRWSGTSKTPLAAS